MFGDGGRTGIERAAEDERETEDVVHLVRVVRTTRGHDDIRPGGFGVRIGDFGVRVGHGEDDGILGHGLDHGRG